MNKLLLRLLEYEVIELWLFNGSKFYTDGSKTGSDDGRNSW